METPLILIIDDSPSDRKLLKTIVERLGYPTHLCDDGDAGMLYLSKANTSPLAVLLDIHMPGIDGISILGHLRSRFKRLPVMIVTGSEDMDDLNSAANLGATWVFRKTSAEYLSQAISSALVHILPKQEAAVS